MANRVLRDMARIIDQGAMEDFLHGIGLQRRSMFSAALSALGLFTAGLIAGAAVSLLFAPKTGQEVRQDIAQRMATLREEVKDKVQSAAKKGERYNPPS